MYIVSQPADLNSFRGTNRILVLPPLFTFHNIYVKQTKKCNFKQKVKLEGREGEGRVGEGRGEKRREEEGKGGDGYFVYFTVVYQKTHLKKKRLQRLHRILQNTK